MTGAFETTVSRRINDLMMCAIWNNNIIQQFRIHLRVVIKKYVGIIYIFLKCYDNIEYFVNK